MKIARIIGMKRFNDFSLKILLLLLGVLALSQSIHAAIFKVTTSEELQAALSTAAANGGDDEIFWRQAPTLEVLSISQRKILLSKSPQN